MGVVLLFLLLTGFTELSIAGSHLQTLPSYVDVCYRDDPDNSQCIKKCIQNMLPLLKNGFMAFKVDPMKVTSCTSVYFQGSTDFDLEPIDPLTFRNLVFKYDSALIGGKITINNAKVTGLSRITVLEVRPEFTNPKKFLVAFDAYLPLLNVKSDFKLVGNVLQLSTTMNCRVHMDLENVTVTYTVEADVEEEEGRDYLVLRKFFWRTKGEGIQRMTVLNQDIVRGRPALNKFVRSVLRSSWRLLKDIILPKLLPETDKLLTNMFTNFINKYPYDVLLPKLPASKDTTKITTEVDISQ